MDTIFNNIINATNLEDILDNIKSNYLQEYYAIFIGELAYWKYITISADLAAKLYIIISNANIKNLDNIIENIDNYLINRELKNGSAETE